jgi:hypothetical protein
VGSRPPCSIAVRSGGPRGWTLPTLTVALPQRRGPMGAAAAVVASRPCRHGSRSWWRRCAAACARVQQLTRAAAAFSMGWAVGCVGTAPGQPPPPARIAQRTVQWQAAPPAVAAFALFNAKYKAYYEAGGGPRRRRGKLSHGANVSLCYLRACTCCLAVLLPPLFWT